MRRLGAWVALALAAGCGDAAGPQVHVTMTVGPGAPAYGETPFPSDALLEEGRIGPIAGLEPMLGPDGDRVLRHLATLDGFGLRPAIEFFVEGDLDEASLPARTATATDAVFVVELEAGTVVPMDWRWNATRHVLVGSPALGTTLREGTRYAAVATGALHVAGGGHLAAAEGLRSLALGEAPSPRWSSTAEVARTVSAWPLAGDLVGLTVFTTQHATATLVAARNALENDELAPTLSFPEPALIFQGEGLEPLLGQATRWTEGPRAGQEIWGADNPTGIAHDHVGVFASGVMTAPRFRRDDTGTEEPDDETFDVASPIAVPRLIAVDRIPVTFVLPRTPAPPDGYPILIFGHGLGNSREHILPLMEPWTSAGFAIVVIDFVSHGSRRDAADTKNNAAYTDEFTGDPLLRDGLGDYNGPASQLEFFENFLNVSGVRDGIRQSVLDLCTVTRLVRRRDLDLSALAAPGQPGPRLDARRPIFVGESFGTVIGSVFAAIEPEVGLFVLDVPGGGILDLILPHSETIGDTTLPLLNLLYGLDGRAFDRFDPFVALAQALLDGADPLTYASHVFRERFTVGGRPLGPRHVVAIAVVADQIMPNVATWALARGLGLDELTPSLTVPEGLTSIASPAEGNVDGQTGILVEYAPATHGANWTHMSGTVAFAESYPAPATPPFEKLSVPFEIPNPIYETHAQIREIMTSYIDSGVPRVSMTLPPVADFDGDGRMDVDDPAPSDPSR